MADAGADRSRLLRTVADGPFDRHADLVRRTLDAPASLITVIDHDNAAQRFVGVSGLTGPAATHRGSPLPLSLCNHVAAADEPMIVHDLDATPWLAAHPARVHLGIRAYAGLPLHTPDGVAVGAVCAASFEPREWSQTDVSQLSLLRDVLELDLVAVLEGQDEAERADELSLLLSTLRHELGGELTIVLGGIETARLVGLPAPIHQRVLENAQRETHRVIDTLDALLRLDRRAPARFREVDVGLVVREAATDTPVPDAARRLHVTVDDDIASGPPVLTEPTLLRRLVSNLVDNAAKYTDGNVTVHVTTNRHGRIGVEVADEGGGLSEAAGAQLFEPFTRAHDAGARGFGLGMYIVRLITERLGAQLELRTGDNGTTIALWLPATPPTQPSGESDAKASGDQSPKPSNAASSSDEA